MNYGHFRFECQRCGALTCCRCPGPHQVEKVAGCSACASKNDEEAARLQKVAAAERRAA